jgi:hypothetical protein
MDIFNFTNNENKNFSLAKVLLLFYVLSASHYTTNLYGKEMKSFLEESRIAQHIIAFILMLVIINIIGNIQAIDKLLFYTLFAYVWFLFSSKLNVQFNLIIISLLFIWFLYENKFYINNIIINNDENLSYNDKININNKYKNINIYASAFIFIITLIGVYNYSDKKIIQYGGNFDPLKFIFL